MFDLSGKNVVYVGGFSGIGYQICHILMQKQISHLVICGRMENVEMLKKLQAENATVKVMFVHMNIQDHVNVEQGVKQLIGVIKQIDVLVNGAGVLSDKDVNTTIGVNLLGMIHMTMTCLPYMDKTQMGHGGVVMNIASVYGLEPSLAFPVYAAAKHGVVGFTRSMGDQHNMQHTGVCFICVCPGLTTSETMMNLREKAALGQHQHVAELVDAMNKAKQQTPEECAVQVVKAVELMKSGAIYICNLGQLKEIVPTVHWHI